MNDVDPNEVVETVADRVEQGFARLVSGMTADDLFASEAVGDRTLITAVAVDRAGGFGFGAGGGGEGAESGSGGGGGGGGSAQGRPVAVIEVGPSGVEVHPVIDVTKVAVTAVISAVAIWRVFRKTG
jgi:uncharacterized spore protein YtfJ